MTSTFVGRHSKHLATTTALILIIVTSGRSSGITANDVIGRRQHFHRRDLGADRPAEPDEVGGPGFEPDSGILALGPWPTQRQRRTTMRRL